MPKDRGGPVVTVLSRFFDANAQLVAGVCSKCYLEGDEDVKIVAVNRRFLLRGAPPHAPTKGEADAKESKNGNGQEEEEEEGGEEVGAGPFQVPRTPLWSPPRSPHNLIEESLFRDPWALLVATIFLNKTSCRCARPRVEQFLGDFSGPLDVLQREPRDLERYFADLGLFKRRAEQVWRMSRDYVKKRWRRPGELYGIGKYGEDAYRMFVLGDLDVEPDDRFLRIYRDWARMTSTSHGRRRREEGGAVADDDDAAAAAAAAH